MLEGGSDDEGASTEAQGRAIIEVLGRDKRNEVLAALYMVRTDVSISVRQVRRRSTYYLFFLTWINYFIFVYICLMLTEFPHFPGCFTCVENHSGKYSKDSQGNYASSNEYSNYFSCIIIIRKAAGLHLYIGDPFLLSNNLQNS